MSFLSQPATQIFIKPMRILGDIALQVVISENTSDNLTVTKQPVQQGASITDHAYLEPTVFSGTAYFKDNTFSTVNGLSPLSNPAAGLAKIYQTLLDLQSSRVPFGIVTPKRIYASMLLTTLSQTTDKATENTLAINFSCQQIIIVSVSTANVPRIRQKNPGATGATQNAGQKQSALYTGSQAFGFNK